MVIRCSITHSDIKYGYIDCSYPVSLNKRSGRRRNVDLFTRLNAHRVMKKLRP